MKNLSKLKRSMLIISFLIPFKTFSQNVDSLIDHTRLGNGVLHSLSRGDISSALELLEKNDVEVSGYEAESDRIEGAENQIISKTRSSLEHIAKRVKEEVNSIDNDEIIKSSKIVKNSVDMKIIESELVKSKDLILKMSDLGAFTRDSFLLTLDNLIIDVKDVRLSAAVLNGAITSTIPSYSLEGFDRESKVSKHLSMNNSITYLLLFVLTSCLIALSLKSKKLKKENFELENKDWSSYISKKSFKSQMQVYETLNDVGTVVIDQNEKILTVNSYFNEMFADSFNGNNTWTEFFARNFKREKSLKGTFSIYKYMRDVTSDYMIQFSKPDSLGRKTCFIIKFDAGFLAKLGNNRVLDLEKMKVNILDVIDEVIAQENSFKDKNFLELKDVDYANDLYLYMPEKQAKAIFEKSVKALLAVQSIKNSSKRAVLSVKRKDKNLIFTAVLPGIHLDVRDFSKEVATNVSLNTMMKGIESIEGSYGVTSVWKNTKKDSVRAVTFEMMISDLENVKVEQWEYSL